MTTKNIIFISFIAVISAFPVIPIDNSTEETPSCQDVYYEKFCASAANKTAGYCNVNGFYCDNITVEVIYQTEGGPISCNQTTAQECPAGYYCPSPIEKKPCPPGHYCRAGSSFTQVCTMGELDCPDHQEEQINRAHLLSVLVMFFVFFLIVTESLSNYWIREEEKLINGIIKFAEDNESLVARAALTDLNKKINSKANLSTSHFFGNSLTSLQNSDNTKSQLLDLYEAHTSNSGEYNGKSFFKDYGNRSTSLDDSNGAAKTANTKAIAMLELSVNDLSEKKISLDTSPEDFFEVESPNDTSQPTKYVPVPVKSSSAHFEFSEKHGHAPSVLESIARKGNDPTPFIPNEVENTIDVVFKGMNLRLKSNNALILNNLCGELPHGRITALMGPSGAGKTTLLSLLRGQAYFADTEGILLVNNVRHTSLQEFSESIAYVSQDDIMYDELTCEENVVCAGLLFNRRGYHTLAEIIPMVYYTLQLLGLLFVRRSPVGNASVKGVSGGQKKRVSVAMEMMKEAPLFLLDEPTSGLDSASSINLFNALHTLAGLGHNVVATIHQPRQEIVDLLDNLILLAPGGRMVFCEPAHLLGAHFNGLGYALRPGSNVADFVMDVLAGFVSREGESTHESVPELIEYLCGWWETNKYPPLIKRLEEESANSDAALPSNQKKKELSWNLFATVFSVVAIRHIRIFQRTYSSFRFTCFLLIVMGMIVAALFGSLDLAQTSNPLAQISAMQLTFGLLSITFGLKLFKNDTLMRRREEEGGLWLFPYFLGKLLGSTAELLVYPLIFLFGYYPLVKAAGSFINYWGLLTLFQFSIIGLANFVAIVVPGTNCNLTANGLLVILWSFGGIEPSLTVIKERMGGFGEAINMISPFKWSFEKQVIIELHGNYSPLYEDSINAMVYKFGYDLNDTKKDTGALISYYLIATALGFFWMVWARDYFRIWREIKSFVASCRSSSSPTSSLETAEKVEKEEQKESISSPDTPNTNSVV